MANKTIPQLPEQTGLTDNDLLAIVDSGETTTSKIKVSTLLGGVAGSPLVQTIGASGENVDSNFSDGGTPFDANGFDTDYNNLVVGWGNNDGTANTTTRNNVIFGYDNTIFDSTTSKVVFGFNNTDSSQAKVLVGNGNTSIRGMAIGESSLTKFNDANTMVIGFNSDAGNLNTLTIGAASTANNRATAIGSSTSSQNYGFAGGFGANCGGERNVVLGQNTISSSGLYNSILGGFNNVIGGSISNSAIIGLNAFTATDSRMVYVPMLQLIDYASYNYSGDTAAAAGGVQLGGVYHDNGALRVRIT
jgi:hypothetical protein